MADFLETADYPTPEGWERGARFRARTRSSMLPRSKISMDAERVAVEAIADVAGPEADWEQATRGASARPALRLALDISAPRAGDLALYRAVHFPTSRARASTPAPPHTEAGRTKIISAGIAAGVKGAVDCTIGLGVPSPDWPDAVARGIAAVRDMGGGSLTFSDADITLIAADGHAAGHLRPGDRRARGRSAGGVFAARACCPSPEIRHRSRPAGPPEFIATLGPAGSVQLRGRVAERAGPHHRRKLRPRPVRHRQRLCADAARPGAARGWAVRTLAGLEALDQLADGRVVVRPDVVDVAGATGDKGASAEISRLLSEKLGEAEDFRVNVTIRRERWTRSRRCRRRRNAWPTSTRRWPQQQDHLCAGLGRDRARRRRAPSTGSPRS